MQVSFYLDPASLGIGMLLGSLTTVVVLAVWAAVKMRKQ
jgi:hypothetical protein